MIIFLYGADTFRSRIKLREIRSSYRKKYGDGISEIALDASDISFADFLSHFEKESLFVSKRLFVVERPEKNREFIKLLCAYPSLNKAGKSKNIFLVFWVAQDVKKDKEMMFLLGQAEMRQEFAPLPFPLFRLWLQKFARAWGVKFQPPALTLVAQWAEGDSWKAARDIQKLHAYTNGGIVCIEDVEKLCAPSLQVYIFHTVDALFEGNAEQGIEHIEKHLERGEKPLYLVTMLVRQLRMIALLKDGQALRHSSGQGRGFPQTSLGIDPYVVRKVLPFVGRISWDALCDLFCAAHKTDLAIKKGDLDSRLGAELLALRIANSFINKY